MSNRGRINSSEDSEHEQILEGVIADYIRACEAGSPPDRRKILELHPEFADDLREFFGHRDRMNQLAEPIRGFRDDQFQSVGPGQQISYIGNYELLEEVARGGKGRADGSPVGRSSGTAHSSWRTVICRNNCVVVTTQR